MGKGIRSFEFGDFRFDVPQNLLLQNGDPVLLSPKALQILRFLLEQRGRVVTKEELFKEIWPDCYVDETNLTQHIYRIRKALDSASVFIETIPKFGYRFNGEVSETGIGADHSSSGRVVADPEISGMGRFRLNSAGGSEDTGNDHRLPDTAARQSADFKRINLGWILLALVFTSLVGVSFVIYQRTLSTARLKSVTVLPFKHIGAPADDRLEAGLTDTVVSELAKNERLVLVPSDADRDIYRNPRLLEEPLVIGKKLGVDIVVTGTIQTEHGLARVNLKFYDVRRNRQYCSARFDREYSEAFALQDVIADRTAEKLRYEMDRHDKDMH